MPPLDVLTVKYEVTTKSDTVGAGRDQFKDKPMIFYDCSTAPSPRRTRIFLAEKGADVETRDINLGKGEQLADDFLSINPRATVPVLMTDDGVALTENVAIASYLEDAFPEPPLMGRTPTERAEILMWNAICEAQGLLAVADALRNANPHMKGRAVTGPVNFDQIPALAERGMTRVGLFYKLLDERFANQSNIVGNTLSFADITAFVVCDFARVIKMRVDETYPNLHTWYQAMKDRPSAAI